MQSTWTLLKKGWQQLRRSLEPALAPGIIALAPASQAVCCASTGDVEPGLADTRQPVASSTEGNCSSSCDASDSQADGSCSLKPVSFRRRLFDETWAATTMVVKFMALAFFLEALIQLYVPSAWIAGILGNQNPWAIPLAAGLGVPVYTSNLAALPLISGLLAQGMTPAAGLAFLIAGPTTTLPAMAAVWGLASRRVFALYVSFSLVGAMALGYSYHLVTMLW